MIVYFTHGVRNLLEFQESSDQQLLLLIYGKVYEKRDLAFIIKMYNKNALRLICYNFRTVNAINFLFSTLHTAPFLYGIIHLESCTCSVSVLQRLIPDWVQTHHNFR